MSWRRLGTASVFLLASFSASAGAQPTEPRMEAAETAYREGRFEQARQILDRVAAGNGLETFEDVWELLLLRVRVSTAMRDEAAVTRYLRSLARLDPERELPAEIPPSGREQFAALADTVEPLRVEVSHEGVFGGAVLRADVGDISSSELVRAVRLHARTPGGEWLSDEDTVMRVQTPTGTVIEYYAEVIGPGGAVIARAGSEQQPFEARAAGAAAETAGGPDPPASSSEAASPWPTIVGVGLGALVVAAAVGLGVYFGRQPSSTRLQAPAIRW